MIEQHPWFTHRHKNAVIVMLAAAVVTLLAGFRVQTYRLNAYAKPSPRDANVFSYKVDPNTTRASDGAIGFGMWRAMCDYAAHMRSEANVAGDDQAYWYWDGIVAECESYGLGPPISN